MQLKIEGVSKTFPNGVCALREVTLTIPEGIFGVVGPARAGKTTLVRMITAATEPDCGRILFDDIDAVYEKDVVRSAVGYLPQEFGVYPRATAESLFSYFATLKGVMDRRVRRATVDALLQRVNLWDARFEKLGCFSRGMHQRFGLAVALLGDPAVLVLDSPTAGLNFAERSQFLNLVRDVAGDRVVLLATQNIQDAMDVCAQTAIIDGGEILMHTESPTTERDLNEVYRTVVDARNGKFRAAA